MPISDSDRDMMKRVAAYFESTRKVEDPNAKYKLTELNPDATPRIEAGQTLTGAQLMQAGVQVKFPDKVSSVNIKLDKVQ